MTMGARCPRTCSSAFSDYETEKDVDMDERFTEEDIERATQAISNLRHQAASRRTKPKSCDLAWAALSVISKPTTKGNA